jgi:nitrogen regulatory protein P-II 1
MGKGVNEHQMKMVQVIIRAERMPDLKEHLRSIGVGGMTVYTVSGWSKKRELHLQWRGQPVSYDLIPRTKFEIVIPDEQLDTVIRTITERARSGSSGDHGDGIIFVSTIEHAINIATLEKDEKGIK